MTEVTCEWCNSKYVRKRRTNRTCSKSCMTLLNNFRHRKLVEKKDIDCVICGTCFTQARSDSKYCSKDCFKQYSSLKRKTSYTRLKDRRNDPQCLFCGKTFQSVRSDAVYCSHYCSYKINYNSARRVAEVRAWQDQNKDRVRLYKTQNKMKRRNIERSSAGITHKDWQRTINRYNGKCAYCLEKEWEHMDHVVPISKGGKHTIGNVLPACQRCNLSKGAKIIIRLEE